MRKSRLGTKDKVFSSRHASVPSCINKSNVLLPATNVCSQYCRYSALLIVYWPFRRLAQSVFYKTLSNAFTTCRLFQTYLNHRHLLPSSVFSTWSKQLPGNVEFNVNKTSDILLSIDRIGWSGFNGFILCCLRLLLTFVAR